MPAALTPTERLTRAQDLVAQARALTEPSSAHAHGRWVVRRRALLGKAQDLLRRDVTTRRNNKPFTAEQTTQATALLQAIDQLWPQLRK
jgi:hypothetical protein